VADFKRALLFLQVTQPFPVSLLGAAAGKIEFSLVEVHGSSTKGLMTWMFVSTNALLITLVAVENPRFLPWLVFGVGICYGIKFEKTFYSIPLSDFMVSLFFFL
jgi:hypothetical protein